MLTRSCRISAAPSLLGCGCRASQDFRGAQGTSSSLDYRRMFLDSYPTLKGTPRAPRILLRPEADVSKAHVSVL
jgi:hypothetical protein